MFVRGAGDSANFRSVAKQPQEVDKGALPAQGTATSGSRPRSESTSLVPSILPRRLCLSLSTVLLSFLRPGKIGRKQVEKGLLEGERRWTREAAEEAGSRPPGLELPASLQNGFCAAPGWAPHSHGSRGQSMHRRRSGDLAPGEHQSGLPCACAGETSLQSLGVLIASILIY